MDFLNDIKVYDNVIDERACIDIFQFLSRQFYVLQRSNDAGKLEEAKSFLRISRSPEEVEEYKRSLIAQQQQLTDGNTIPAADKYWTRIHKGAPECKKEDEDLCRALYQALEGVCPLPPYEMLGNVYTNMLRSMDRPKAHIDNLDEKNRTVMFYTNSKWHRDWGGETVFYDFDDNIIKSVLPKAGRVVSFDGRIPHSARPPVTAAYEPRYITVMKF